MKILITGITGQLGKSLIDIKPENHEIIAPKRDELDISNTQECENIIKENKPDWLINCGAFVDVDSAEFKKDIAMRINTHAPTAFAKAIKEQGGNLIQISTDYVFEGNKRNLPYKIDDETNPQNLYGYSKLKAEESIRKLLCNKRNGIILRTSWLISPYGENFVLKMLKLFHIKDQLKIVSDQIGSPTSASSLANICWEIVNLKNKSLIFENNTNGILHWCDNGQTSWCELAKSIRDLSKEIGLLKKNVELIPIKSYDYKTSATRPKYSVLDSSNTKKIFKISGNDWRVNLRYILEKILINKDIHNL